MQYGCQRYSVFGSPEHLPRPCMQLEDVIATRKLDARCGDEIDAPQYAKLVEAVSEALDGTRNSVYHAIAGCAQAGRAAVSSGISVFAHPQYDELTWKGVVGPLDSFSERRFPQRHSMCGVVSDTGEEQLFELPQRFFEWMQQVDRCIAEALVVPVFELDDFLGTVWLMSHDVNVRFDGTDLARLRLLASLMPRALRRVDG